MQAEYLVDVRGLARLRRRVWDGCLTSSVPRGEHAVFTAGGGHGTRVAFARGPFGQGAFRAAGAVQPTELHLPKFS